MKFFISGQNKNLFFISGFKKLSKKSLVYLGIVVLASLLSLGLIWRFSKIPEIKKEIPLPEKLQPKTETLTPEKIQEALSKKAGTSTEIQPLNEKETQSILSKKIPKNERPTPLSPEEIQRALNEKAEPQSTQ
ncbi:hypothetical protein KJ636_02245 [Patescibacteria group bacterium]|nr:hypothetical protein [Patescibacteria group bacterium]